ncbi:MAG: Chromate resistance protein ChrB [Marmoricola sp.]
MLVTISLTAGHASLRVHVWRKLRSLGAVYLQSSVCLLPERTEVKREVRRLLDRVRTEGGTGRFLQVELSEPGEVDWLHGEFNAARDGEYGEVMERLPSLLAELASERAKGRTTYAEVEESEADLQRFRTWMGKIERRDYFAAPLGEQARAAVDAAARDLVEFEAEAMNAEAPSVEAPRLRAVRSSSRRKPAQSG